MKQIKQIVKDVERDIMVEIIFNMKHYDLSVEQSREISKDFLSVFPVTAMPELIKALQLLGKKYKEIRVVYIKHANKYYDEQKYEILEAVPSYIQTGNIDGAVTLIKGGTHHE